MISRVYLPLVTIIRQCKDHYQVPEREALEAGKLKKRWRRLGTSGTGLASWRQAEGSPWASCFRPQFWVIA